MHATVATFLQYYANTGAELLVPRSLRYDLSSLARPVSGDADVAEIARATTMRQSQSRAKCGSPNDWFRDSYLSVVKSLLSCTRTSRNQLPTHRRIVQATNQCECNHSSYRVRITFFLHSGDKYCPLHGIYNKYMYFSSISGSVT